MRYLRFAVFHVSSSHTGEDAEYKQHQKQNSVETVRHNVKVPEISRNCSNFCSEPQAQHDRSSIRKDGANPAGRSVQNVGSTGSLDPKVLGHFAHHRSKEQHCRRTSTCCRSPHSLYQPTDSSAERADLQFFCQPLHQCVKGAAAIEDFQEDK